MFVVTVHPLLTEHLTQLNIHVRNTIKKLDLEYYISSYNKSYLKNISSSKFVLYEDSNGDLTFNQRLYKEMFM